MQKQIATCLMVSMLTMLLGPSLGAAAYGVPVTTSLTPQLGAVSSDPINVLAKWEMKGPCFNGTTYNACAGVPGEGKDDSTNPGAQFAAPGVWEADMNYTICAVVHGPENNIGNIDRVITEIFYPKTPMHKSGHEVCSIDTSDEGVANSDGAEIDNPTGGCGAMIEQNFLHKLTQAEGINLVCNSIQSGNNNLINTWASGATYNSLCNTTNGELVKAKAAVYCVDKHLIWEDPAGNYPVNVWAFDKSNNQSKVFANTFNYVETKGFELDFTGVNYGEVKIGTHKQIFGDKCFGVGDETVRNVGNVPLTMKLAQDDMGLGYQTDSTNWNVQYDARVGDLETDWAVFSPFGVKSEVPDSFSDYTLLNEKLDLSEIEEMDFSIFVPEKWPQNQASYSGTMWIGAIPAAFADCN